MKQRASPLMEALGFALLVAIALSAFARVPAAGLSGSLANPFGSCWCTYFAYDSAPLPVQRLIKWTKGTAFDGYPAPLQGLSWDGTEWASNVQTYGPKMDPKLDWAGAVNQEPAVGAIVVYAGGSTTTWMVGNTKHSWKLSDAGHVAVVTAYDSGKRTINTSDKNWGNTPCLYGSRTNVDVTSSMQFIHSPAPFPQGAPPDTGTTESTELLRTEFYSKLPWRNIWVESGSRFELSIDGQSVMAKDRPAHWSTFSQQRVFATPFKNHTVLIKWWKRGPDPEPQFSQTWWPNTIIQAAEPDPGGTLEVSYNYFLRPMELVKGEPASISVAASTNSAFTIQSIEVRAGEFGPITIDGASGSLTLPTERFTAGPLTIHLLAKVPDWPGPVAEATVQTSVSESGSPAPAPPSNPEPPVTAPPIAPAEPPSGEIGIPNSPRPEDGASYRQTKDITLAWNATSNAAQYKVELWGGPYSTMTPCDWQAATSCHIGRMWPGAMSWHVKARGASGNESGWSSTWSFVIRETESTPSEQPPAAPPPAAGPEVPSLSDPGNGASYPQSSEIVLSWNAATNATQYKVELWGGPYSTMTPCDWQRKISCRIGQMWPGNMSWHVKARSGDGTESDWSPTWNFTIGPVENQPAPPAPPPEQPNPPPSQPASVDLVDDLSLRTESGNWPPQAGEKLIAHIKVRNGGDLLLHIEHLGVRGRKNGSDFWDIGFWTVDLNGHQEWSLDPNNERPLEPGNYSFRLSYSLNGSKWTEIGSEINFTVP